MIVSSCFQYLFALQTFSLLVHVSVGVIYSNDSNTEDAYLPPSEYEDFYKLRIILVTDRVFDDMEKRFEIISIAQKKYFNKIKTQLVIVAYDTFQYSNERGNQIFSLDYHIKTKWGDVESQYDFGIFVTSKEFANENRTTKWECIAKNIELSVGSNWEVEDNALYMAMQMGYVQGEDKLSIGETDKCIKKSIPYVFYSYHLTNGFCGNGIADKDEQCDYQTFGYRKNDSYIIHSQEVCSNCTLQGDAECFNEPCCNSNTFKIKPAGTICRKSFSKCDTPEYCDGVSKFCPEDTMIDECINNRNFYEQCYNNGMWNTFGSCVCPQGYSGQYCQYKCPNCCGGSSHSNYCYKDGYSSESQLLTSRQVKIITPDIQEYAKPKYAMDGLKCNYVINYLSAHVPARSWFKIDMLDIRRVTRIVVYSYRNSDFDLHLQVDEMSPVQRVYQSANYDMDQEYSPCIIIDYHCSVIARLVTIRTKESHLDISEVEIYVRKYDNQLPIISKTEWVMERKVCNRSSCNESQLQDSQNQTYSVAYLESIYYISYLKLVTTSSESVNNFDCEIKTSLFHEQRKPLIACDQSEVTHLDNGEYFVSCRSYGNLIIMNSKECLYKLESVHGTKENMPVSFYTDVRGRPSSLQMSDLVNGDTRLPSIGISSIRVDLLVTYRVHTVIVYLSSASNNSAAITKHAHVYLSNVYGRKRRTRNRKSSRKYCQPSVNANNNSTNQLVFGCDALSRFVLLRLSCKSMLDTKQILVFGNHPKSFLNPETFSTSPYNFPNYSPNHYMRFIDKQYNYHLNETSCGMTTSLISWVIHLNDFYEINAVQFIIGKVWRGNAGKMKIIFERFLYERERWKKLDMYQYRFQIPGKAKVWKISSLKEIASMIGIIGGTHLCEVLVYGKKVGLAALKKDFYIEEYFPKLENEPPSNRFSPRLWKPQLGEKYFWATIDIRKYYKHFCIDFRKIVRFDHNHFWITTPDNATERLSCTGGYYRGVYTKFLCARCHHHYDGNTLTLTIGVWDPSKFGVNTVKLMILAEHSKDSYEFKTTSEFSELSPLLTRTSIYGQKEFIQKRAINGKFECAPNPSVAKLRSVDKYTPPLFVRYDLRAVFHLQTINVTFDDAALINSSYSVYGVKYIKLKAYFRFKFIKLQRIVNPQYVRILEIEYLGKDHIVPPPCNITLVPVKDDNKKNIALLMMAYNFLDDNDNKISYSTMVRKINDGISPHNCNDLLFCMKIVSSVVIDLRHYYDITDVIVMTIIQTEDSININSTTTPGNITNWIGIQIGVLFNERKPIVCNNITTNSELYNVYYRECNTDGRYVRIFRKSETMIQLAEVIVHGKKKTSMWKPWQRTVKQRIDDRINVTYRLRECRIVDETFLYYPSNIDHLCPLSLGSVYKYFFNVSTFPDSRRKPPRNILFLPNFDDTRTLSKRIKFATFESQLNLSQVIHIDAIYYKHDRTPIIKSLKFILYKTRVDYNSSVHAVKRIRNYFTARCELYATKSIIILATAESNNLNMRNFNIYGFKAILCDAVIPTDNMDLSTPILLPDENIYCDLRNPEKSWMIFYKKTSATLDNYIWTTYKLGFQVTNASGLDIYRRNDPSFANLIDFYIGNDRIHNLSAIGHKLQIRLVFSKRLDIDYMSENYVYNKFYMDNETNNFKIKFKTPGRRILIDRGQKSFSGRRGYFEFANGQSFSTLDRDNDKENRENCAEIRKAPGWYGECKSDVPRSMPEYLFRPYENYPIQFIYARFLRKVTYEI